MNQSLSGLLAACVAIGLLGCGAATVDVTRRAGAAAKPRVVLVRDFAVTPDDVRLDRSPTKSLERGGRSVSEEEVRIGRAVADALSRHLVEELRSAGIQAERFTDASAIDRDTLVVMGQFLSVDEGSRAKRSLVGFGLGASKLHTHVEAWYGGRLVAEAETSSRSNLKPGLAVMLPAGAAAGTLAVTAAVASAATVGSETVSTTIEAEARRTAKAIGQEIRSAYQRRGWLEDR